jgi:signal transduction histidine kinase
VLGNPERTYEVFATLFDNARRHAGGSQVSVRAATDEEWVTVAVEDSGPGLPASLPERIFDRGWTTSRRQEGMGLGLHLARRLMEEQGGELTASNRPGGGASFLMRFPAAEAAGAKPHLALHHSEKPARPKENAGVGTESLAG